MKVGLGKVDAALERLERAVKELLVDLTDLCGNVEVFHDAHVDKAHSGLVLLGRLEDDGPVPGEQSLKSLKTSWNFSSSSLE